MTCAMRWPRSWKSFPECSDYGGSFQASTHWGNVPGARSATRRGLRDGGKNTPPVLPIPATYPLITTCPGLTGLNQDWLNQERIQCNCANDTIGAYWCAQATLLPRGGHRQGA